MSARHIALAIATLIAPAAATASTLDITPLLIDVRSGGSNTAVLTLRNRGTGVLTLQLRVASWSQVEGTDVLKTDQEVVASPPFITLKPGTPYTIRLLRVSKSVIQGEEARRLIIDELPSPGAVTGGTVQLALRYVIPVFFSDAAARPSTLSWRVTAIHGSMFIEATNGGDRRTRITDLALRSADEKPAVVAFPGLSGYVLGHSMRRWPLSAAQATSVTSVSYDDETGKQVVELPIRSVAADS